MWFIVCVFQAPAVIAVDRDVQAGLGDVRAPGYGAPAPAAVSCGIQSEGHGVGWVTREGEEAVPVPDQFMDVSEAEVRVEGLRLPCISCSAGSSMHNFHCRRLLTLRCGRSRRNVLIP